MKKHMSTAAKTENHTLAKIVLAIVAIVNIAVMIMGQAWPRLEPAVIITWIVFGWFLYKGKTWAQVIFTITSFGISIIGLAAMRSASGLGNLWVILAPLGILCLGALFGFKPVNDYFKANKKSRARRRL